MPPKTKKIKAWAVVEKKTGKLRADNTFIIHDYPIFEREWDADKEKNYDEKVVPIEIILK